LGKQKHFFFWEFYDSHSLWFGLCSLSTAIHLRRRIRKQLLLILERVIFRQAASTKNGGFSLALEVDRDFWMILADDSGEVVQT